MSGAHDRHFEEDRKAIEELELVISALTDYIEPGNAEIARLRLLLEELVQTYYERYGERP